MAKKSILFVINTLGMGGAERALIALLSALPYDRIDLYLYVMMNRGELFVQVPSRIHILNEEPDSGSVLDQAGRRKMAGIVLKSCLKNFNLIRKFPYLLSNYLQQRKRGKVQPEKLFWRLVSDGAPVFDQKFDLAVAYLEGASTYYVADHVKAEHKAAFIHIDYVNAGYTPQMDHHCYDKMEKIFVVSQGVSDSFLKVYPQYQDKTERMSNMLDEYRIKQMAKKGPGFTDGFKGKRILTIGRLHPQKAYDISIPAMKLLKDAGYPVRWYVLGEGPERPNLEKMISDLGLKNDFILLGAKMNPYPYLDEADIYIHATRFEGKSIAIEEAQTLGKAIIASDCTGNREEITNGVDGFLIPLDSQEIFKAAARLLDDEALLDKFRKASIDMHAGKHGDVRPILNMIGEGSENDRK